MKSLVFILAVVCGVSSNQPLLTVNHGTKDNPDFSFQHSHDHENGIVYPEASHLKSLRLRLRGPQDVKEPRKTVGQWVFGPQLEQERTFKTTTKTTVAGSVAGSKNQTTGKDSSEMRFHSGKFDEELKDSSESGAKS